MGARRRRRWAICFARSLAALWISRSASPRLPHHVLPSALSSVSLPSFSSVGPDQGEIGGRNENGVVSCEFEPDHLAGRPFPHVEGLQALQHRQPSLEMNHDRARLRHIRMIESRGPGSGHRLRVMGSAAEHIGRRHHDERLAPSLDEAGIEVGQKRTLAATPFLSPRPSRQNAQP